MTRFTVLLVLAAILMTAGCSNSGRNPLAAFEPEIITTADAFQFQVTDASSVSTTVSYSWENTGTRATVNHSTVTNRGSATVYVLDADSVQVYTAGLVSSLNETTLDGAAGTWTVRVVFADYSGTANFRVERI